MTEDQQKLRLFAFTLTERAKYWLFTILVEPSKPRMSLNKSLYDAWERFKLMPKRFPAHDLSEKSYLQVFIEGLTHSHRMFSDASAGGSMRVKTDHEVQTLIENMSQNEYYAEAEKMKKGRFWGE